MTFQNDILAGTSANQGVASYAMWVWGQNESGELANNDGSGTDKNSPIQIGSADDWTEASMIMGAVNTEGELWTWSQNNFGQLGLGNTTVGLVVAQVGSLTNWKELYCGTNSGIAVKTDGTLWFIGGENSQGESGLGNQISYSSPVQVGSLTNWDGELGMGAYNMCHVKSDGTLWTCGRNSYGGLGHGDTTSLSSPVQVGSLTDWKRVTGGNNFTVGIRTNGTMWAWGRNQKGQLGVGDTTNYSSPVQIGALTTWATVSSNYQYATMAIKTDGTLWGWGYGEHGQTAQGNTTSISSPAQVGSLTNWSDVHAGWYNNVALKTDGTVWCWGRGGDGAMGDGTNISKSSPVQVGSDTTWAVLGHGMNDNMTALVLKES